MKPPAVDTRGEAAAVRGLLLDYNGVLTAPLGLALRAFEREYGLPRGAVLEVLLDAYEAGDADHPIVRYERGEVDAATFEAALAARFANAGHDVPAGGIVHGLLRGNKPSGPMWNVVAQARAAGVRTGVLSNSWGTDSYPVERLAAAFDVVLFSGEIGVRKPDPQAYLLAAEALGLAPEQIVFVDDLTTNVEAAEAVGMSGVMHRDPAVTVGELSARLGVRLGLPAA